MRYQSEQKLSIQSMTKRKKEKKTIYIAFLLLTGECGLPATGR